MGRTSVGRFAKLLEPWLDEKDVGKLNISDNRFKSAKVNWISSL
jgi:hypothetical protein